MRDLLDLLGIDAGLGREIEFFIREPNVGFFELWLKKCMDLGEELSGRDVGQTRLGGSCKEQKRPLTMRFEAIDFIGDDLGVFLFGGARAKMFFAE